MHLWEGSCWTSSTLSPGSGRGSGWQGGAWLCCLTPAPQRHWITCAGKSMACCSASASSPRDVCEPHWPAAQPRCPHRTEDLPAHRARELSSVSQWHLFLSDACPVFPSLHLFHAQRCANTEEEPAVAAQANRRPESSTRVWLPELLQALPLCTAAPGPVAADQHPKAC